MTSTRVSFGLYDTSAKANGTPAAADKQTFIDLDDLKEDDLEPGKYATLEDNLVLLDGSFTEFPDTPAGEPWGLWSLSMSDASGAFSAPPELTVAFTEARGTLGFTLHFYSPTGDYSDHVTIRWYDALNALMDQKDFYPNATDYFCENKVEAFYKVKFTFHSTNNPYRYLKLTGVDYGTAKVFEGDAIISANLLEEVDLLSGQISVNTLNLKLHGGASEFSVLNPDGVFSLLQQGQRADVFEIVSGTEKDMGSFYLDTWENPDESTISLSFVDLVGRADKAETFEGGIFSAVDADDLIDDILTPAGIAYELDASLAAVPISGWLPIISRREAIQQVAFALGAVVDCSRANKIKIYPPPNRATNRITYGRKFSTGQAMKVKPPVTGVDVTAHRYIEGAETTEALNETLAAGTYEVLFNAPLHSLSITGATITESNANRAIITVAAPGAVVLSGSLYVDVTTITRKRMAQLPPGASSNVLAVEDATLVGPGEASAVATRIYDYHQQRYEHEFTMIGGDEVPADIVMVDSMRGEKLRGGLESMSIDLAGGFLAKVRVRGVRIETFEVPYLGEIYAGELVGVI